MNKRVYSLFFLIGSLSLIIASFFAIEIGIALLISYGVGMVCHLLMIWHIERSLAEKQINKKRALLVPIIKNLLYVLSFNIFLLYPNYVIIICVIFGLSLIRICIHIDNYISRKGGTS